MTNIETCPRCKKIFQRLSSPLCKPCTIKDDEDFRRVRDYIDENPLNVLVTVVKDTKVNSQRIRSWLMEGRLLATEGLMDILRCSICLRPIPTWIFCEECAQTVRVQLLSESGTKDGAKVGTIFHLYKLRPEKVRE